MTDSTKRSKSSKASKPDHKSKGGMEMATKDAKEIETEGVGKTDNKEVKDETKKARRSTRAKKEGEENQKPCAKSKPTGASQPEPKASRAKSQPGKPSEKTVKGKDVKRNNDKGKDDKNDKKASPAGDGPATWAGRWIPTEEPALSKFKAIQIAFNDGICHRVKGQSLLQSPFFKLCNAAFKSLSATAKMEDYIACAKMQVDKFLQEEAVSALTTFVFSSTDYPTCLNIRQTHIPKSFQV